MPVGIGLLGFWLLVAVGPDGAEGELLRSCEQTVPVEQDWHGYEHTAIPARAVSGDIPRPRDKQRASPRGHLALVNGGRPNTRDRPCCAVLGHLQAV